MLIDLTELLGGIANEPDCETLSGYRTLYKYLLICSELTEFERRERGVQPRKILKGGIVVDSKLETDLASYRGQRSSVLSFSYSEGRREITSVKLQCQLLVKENKDSTASKWRKYM